MRTVFTDPEGIRQAIQYCRDTLVQNLPEWHVYFDEKHNLIHEPKYAKMVDEMNKKMFDWLERTDGMLIPLRRDTKWRAIDRGPVKQ